MVKIITKIIHIFDKNYFSLLYLSAFQECLTDTKQSIKTVATIVKIIITNLRL